MDQSFFVSRQAGKFVFESKELHFSFAIKACNQELVRSYFIFLEQSLDDPSNYFFARKGARITVDGRELIARWGSPITVVAKRFGATTGLLLKAEAEKICLKNRNPAQADSEMVMQKLKKVSSQMKSLSGEECSSCQVAMEGRGKSIKSCIKEICKEHYARLPDPLSEFVTFLESERFRSLAVEYRKEVKPIMDRLAAVVEKLRTGQRDLKVELLSGKRPLQNDIQSLRFMEDLVLSHFIDFPSDTVKSPEGFELMRFKNEPLRAKVINGVDWPAPEASAPFRVLKAEEREHLVEVLNQSYLIRAKNNSVFEEGDPRQVIRKLAPAENFVVSARKLARQTLTELREVAQTFSQKQGQKVAVSMLDPRINENLLEEISEGKDVVIDANSLLLGAAKALELRSLLDPTYSKALLRAGKILLKNKSYTRIMSDEEQNRNFSGNHLQGTSLCESGFAAQLEFAPSKESIEHFHGRVKEIKSKFLDRLGPKLSSQSIKKLKSESETWEFLTPRPQGEVKTALMGYISESIAAGTRALKDGNFDYHGVIVSEVAMGCKAEARIGFPLSDAADTASGKVLVSSTSVRYREMADFVIQHELAHIASRHLKSGQASDETTKVYAETLLCLNRKHDGTAVSKEKVKDTVLETTQFTEEDFADLVGGIVADRSTPNPWCAMYFPNKEDSWDLKMMNMADVHSSYLFRLLHIEMVARKLPEACNEAVQDFGIKTDFKACL